MGSGQSQLLERLVSSKGCPPTCCASGGDPLLRRGALLALSANYVKGRLRLCIGSVTEPGILRTSPTNGVLRSRYPQAIPTYSKDSPFLGYVLMPYRLDTYDAMASLAVTADTSMKRCSIATPTPSGVHLSGVERRP